MTSILDAASSHKVYTSADAAAAVAQSYNAADDGWTYEVRVDPNGTGKAIIAVLDEDGFFLGFLPASR